MLADFNQEGEAIGIEFVAPSKVTLAKVNALLEALGEDSASLDELWPLIDRATQTQATTAP
jgi:hypothetical protein